MHVRKKSHPPSKGEDFPSEVAECVQNFKIFLQKQMDALQDDLVVRFKDEVTRWNRGLHAEKQLSHFSRPSPATAKLGTLSPDDEHVSWSIDNGEPEEYQQQEPKEQWQQQPKEQPQHEQEKPSQQDWNGQAALRTSAVNMGIAEPMDKPQQKPKVQPQQEQEEQSQQDRNRRAVLRTAAMNMGIDEQTEHAQQEQEEQSQQDPEQEVSQYGHMESGDSDSDSVKMDFGRTSSMNVATGPTSSKVGFGRTSYCSNASDDLFIPELDFNIASAVEEKYAEQIRLRATINEGTHRPIMIITGGWLYQALIGLMIISNSVFIGWQVDHQARYAYALDIETPLSYAFCVIFTIDILLRLREERIGFFVGESKYWNAFDSFLVASMIFEASRRITGKDVNVASSQLSSLRVLRLTRIMRIFRILRILRSMSFMKELRVLFIAVMSTSAWRSLVWMFIMVAMFIYLGALIITNGVGDAGNCSIAENEDTDLCRNFGTLWKSALSFYKALYGGIPWGNFIHILDELGYLYLGLFFSLMSLFFLLLGNVCTGVVIKIVYDAVESTKEYLIMEKEEENQKLIKLMHEVFCEADIDASGTVSAMEFELLIRKPELELVFHTLDIGTSDVKALFNTLDTDNSGEISIEEFIMGCLRLKGPAKALDLFVMASQMRTIQRDAQEMKNDIKSGIALQTRVKDEGPITPARPRLTLKNGVSMTRMSTKKLSSLPYPRMANGTRLIKMVEMRAMSLRELRDLVSVIKYRSSAEYWVDPQTGKELEPEDVNLHHLVHHYICPATVQDGIVLKGLRTHAIVGIEEGSRVVQLGPHGRRGVPDAEGYAKVLPSGDDMYIHVTRGLFRSAVLGVAGAVEVNDCDCGVPQEVVAPNCISYKELISGKPTKPKWFCSHWWGETIAEFVMCCEEHAQRRVLDEDAATYWVCAYALRQYDLHGDVNQVLILEQTAFWKTMQLVEGVLLMIDSRAVVFSRIWVDFELFVSISDGMKLDMVTVHHQRPVLLSDGILPSESTLMKTVRELQFPVSVLAKGMQTLLQNGTSTVPADRDRVLNFLLENYSWDIDTVNAHLHAYFARAALPQAIKRDILTDFDRANPGTISLPDVMRKDTRCTRLVMSFNHLEKVNDDVVMQIVSGITPGLHDLQVDLQGCYNVTDIGVKAIAKTLPKHLHALQLNCIGCRLIGNDGLTQLAACLPSTLRELQLDFASCQSIDMVGIGALADKVPKSLTSFRATFQGTAVNRNIMSVDELYKVTGRSLVGRLKQQLSRI